MSSDLQFAIQNRKSATAQRGFAPSGFRIVLFLLIVMASRALFLAGAQWPAATAAPEFHRLKLVELVAGPLKLSPMAPTSMTFVVNTTNDTLLAGACAAATPGQCSLREAIVEANANPGADIIDASGVAGTINLTGALPDITEGVTITGPGASLLTVRRSTGGDYRIFKVTTGGTVTFFGLTISNGNAGFSPVGEMGGGIVNTFGGTVSVTNCAISGNRIGNFGEGGGIANHGKMQITNSTITGNLIDGGSFGGGGGGGIFNDGTMDITGSTISGNVVKANGGGGGIVNSGTLDVTNSTISGNSTTIAGLGGGIANTGTLNVINSTITGNIVGSGGAGGGVGGGISNGGGTVTVNNSTISGNSASDASGGIDNLNIGKVTLKSSIVALNTASLFFPDLHGAITSQGYNIVGTTSGATIVATTGDQFGITAAQLKLGALGNNGGPTQTMALGYGSLAIDRGINSSSLTTDQRGVGFARTYDNPAVTNANGGDGTDVGAFEAKQTFPVPDICEIKPWVCQGLCQIPCPLCPAGCIYEIIFEDLADPWKAVLLDPKGNPVSVQQMRRGNQVTMRFRVNGQFADKVDQYTVVFRGGKPGTKPGATFHVKAIESTRRLKGLSR